MKQITRVKPLVFRSYSTFSSHAYRPIWIVGGHNHSHESQSIFIRIVIIGGVQGDLIRKDRLFIKDVVQVRVCQKPDSIGRFGQHTIGCHSVGLSEFKNKEPFLPGSKPTDKG